MRRLAIITNLLTPASAPVYEAIAKRIPEVAVFLTGHEDNRTWQLASSWRFAVHHVCGPVIKTKASRNASPMSDTRYLHLPIGLLHRLIRYRPDCVISSEMGLRTFLAWLYCFTRRVPLVLHWEGTPHNQSRIGFLRRFFRRTFFRRMPDAWVACGSESHRYLTELGVPQDCIIRGAYAVETKRFEAPAEPFEEFPQKPVLLTVGRLVRLKGLQEYLHVISLLQKEGVCFTTLFVGEGPEKEKLELLTTRLGLQDVYFRPFVQPDQLTAIYAAADMHVFPTLCDGWGLVVGEAIAAGLPALSSIYAGATMDLVPEAWRFNPCDTKNFTMAMKRAISVGKAGREDFPETAQLPDADAVASMLMTGLRRASKFRLKGHVHV